MSRKSSERRAQLVVRKEADLRADLERLTAATGGCTWRGEYYCPCHEAELRDLEEIRFLLGEDDR